MLLPAGKKTKQILGIFFLKPRNGQWVLVEAVAKIANEIIIIHYCRPLETKSHDCG